MLLALAVLFLVMLGTGLWLGWHYRPHPTPGFKDVKTLEASSDPSFIRGVHRVTSFVFVNGAIGAAIVSIVAAISGGAGRRVLTAFAGIAALIVGLALQFTGYLLPWDQLALWQVTVGSHMAGAFAATGPHVKYVLMGDREISGSTYERWLWIHIAVLPAIAAATGAFLWRFTRRKRDAEVASTTLPG